MNGHVLYYPFFPSNHLHPIYSSSIWIDSISTATFLRYPYHFLKPPSTLQKDAQSGTDVHPSPFNQAQSRENPNASQPTDFWTSIGEKRGGQTAGTNPKN